jgi:DNA-binding HxlR family transcriptional regulator
LTVRQAEAKGEGLARAGARAMSVLAVPLNAMVVKALAGGPVSLAELRRVAGFPPSTTMRTHLRALTEVEILERRQQREFPGPVEYELTPTGRALLGVAETLDRWLRQSPREPLHLGSSAAKSATKAIAEGWSSGIVRALASRPLALTDLSRLISNLSYPSLERRLGAMRTAGLIEPSSSDGRVRPYAMTCWLRLGIAPIAAAASWERKYLRQETPPIRRLDIEAAFLMALPLVALDRSRSGVCRLTVTGVSEQRRAGVLVVVEAGRVTSCVTRLEGAVDASASGSATAWMGAVLHGNPSRLDLGGERSLAGALIEGLQQAVSRPSIDG